MAGALAALELLDRAAAPRARSSRATPPRSAPSSSTEGFDLHGSRTQIVPLVIGDAELTMRICERALARGVFAQGIRPPTVPVGTSRLRLAVMASHREQELRDAGRILAQAAREAGFEPRARVSALRPQPVGRDPLPVPPSSVLFDGEASERSAEAA